MLKLLPNLLATIVCFVTIYFIYQVHLGRVEREISDHAKLQDTIKKYGDKFRIECGQSSGKTNYEYCYKVYPNGLTVEIDYDLFSSN